MYVHAHRINVEYIETHVNSSTSSHTHFTTSCSYTLHVDMETNFCVSKSARLHAINMAVASGPAGPVLAGPLFVGRIRYLVMVANKTGNGRRAADSYRAREIDSSNTVWLLLHLLWMYPTNTLCACAAGLQ